jgi:hypothetical protein
MDDIQVTVEQTNPIVLEITVEESTVVEVAPQGIPGRDGSALVNRTAAIVLGGHRAVVLDNSELAIYADSSITSHANKVLGLTTGAASSGAIAAIATYGEFTEPSWSWTPGAPIFLGTNGLITQTAPTSGFLLILGFAIATTKIFIDIKQPIIF